MNRFVMSVILPLAVLACVALLIASVGTLFLALGKNALFAALAFVVVIMIAASLLNLKKSDAAEGQHGGGR
ncbi:MAG: hypothetical protein Q7T26_00340 [Dehalococcoidia bacterium]|nr:hypothetical protein [Dehalococcoidia bacterium]